MTSKQGDLVAVGRDIYGKVIADFVVEGTSALLVDTSDTTLLRLLAEACDGHVIELTVTLADIVV